MRHRVALRTLSGLNLRLDSVERGPRPASRHLHHYRPVQRPNEELHRDRMCPAAQATALAAPPLCNDSPLEQSGETVKGFCCCWQRPAQMLKSGASILVSVAL